MSCKADEQELRRIIRAAIDEVLEQDGAASRPPAPRREPEPSRPTRARKPLPPPLSASAIDRIVRASPSRLAKGRTGTRYLTDVYLGLRADHAIALDAVHSEIPEEFAASHKLVALKTLCQSKEEFLLHPDHGRRLDPESKRVLEAEADRGVDIQVILGDGLSAWALVQNGPPLLTALTRDLPAAGFRMGKPLLVRFARIGVQDEIGTVTGAKATIIMVGERPGLGTGDSLSIYTAFNPKLGQDNSEKDCISNIRGLGLTPDEASRRCTELMRRTFEAGGGGVHLQ